jgi:predicted SprT family Zn-dependent metalloprotease
MIDKRKAELLARAEAKLVKIKAQIVNNDQLLARLEKVHFTFTQHPRYGALAYPYLGVIEISLTYYAFHGDEEFEKVIAHEVAHLLTPGHGHDEIWAFVNEKLGGVRYCSASRAVGIEAKYLKTLKKLEKLDNSHCETPMVLIEQHGRIQYWRCTICKVTKKRRFRGRL